MRAKDWIRKVDVRKDHVQLPFIVVQMRAYVTALRCLTVAQCILKVLEHNKFSKYAFVCMLLFVITLEDLICWYNYISYREVETKAIAFCFLTCQ